MSDKLQVFISYARADGEPFALSLVAALEAAGFDPFLDQHDIIGGEDWKRRLTDLLSKADTIVYAITPGAIGSEHCGWEVDEAQRLSKRLIPVVAIEAPVESMPPALQRLNHIHFTRQLSFGEALRQLASALRTDLDWVREHTRINGLAADWRARESREEWLVRGEQLAAAKAWLAARKPGSPEPTDAQRAFIQASAEAEDRRNSVERQQLAAMAAIQADREKALKRAGRANKATFVTSLLLLAVTGVGGAALYLQNEALQEANSALDERDASAELREESLSDQTEKLAQIIDASAPQLGRSDSNPAAPSPAPAEESAAGDGPEEPQPTASEAANARALARISEARWNIDVFWCAGPSGSANEQRAEAVRSALSAELSRQDAGAPGASPLSLGRIRVRELSEAANARKGYQIKTDEVRAETSEQGERDQLFAILAGAGIAAPSTRTATTSTPQYISVFMCAGG